MPRAASPSASAQARDTSPASGKTAKSSPPSTPPAPASTAPAAVRPRIGFSIDFLVGNNTSNNGKEENSTKGHGSPASTPDSSRSVSPNSTAGANSGNGRPSTGSSAGGSPLFTAWNPATSGPAGPYPLDMATLANLRQLYGDPGVAGGPGGAAGIIRPGLLLPGPHGSAFGPPPPPPGFPLPPGPPGAAAGPIRPDGVPPGSPAAANLAAQQWWLLAQARQHQQRLFAAAAAASHRFPPGTVSKCIIITFPRLISFYHRPRPFRSLESN